MAFSGGVFSRLYDWTTDRDNGVKILASRMDQEFDGMATGLSTCILKDGTQTCTAAVPFAEGLTIPDDKTLVFGTDSDVTIQYDETTNNALEIAANVEGAALGVVLKADQGDDNADQWKVNVADGGTLSINSKISGSFVSQLTLTPNATATSSTTAIAGNITVGGTVDGRDLATDGSKLDGIEASADVTDTANVTAAGALMDSEVTNLAQVKSFDSANYATAAQGSTADSALQNVSEDTTPQLGGNLDLNSNNITGTGNIDVTGTVTADDLEVNGTSDDIQFSDTSLTKANLVKYIGFHGSDGRAGYLGYSGTSGAGSFQIFNQNNTAMTFHNNSSEAVRIDSSGRLLVGRTTIISGNEGVVLYPEGLAKLERDSNNPLVLNRLSTDGSIAVFQKDGTTVGSVRSEGGDIVFGNDTRGLKFRDADVIPRDMDNTTADGVVSLGSGTSRFQDLYLSGGAYIGGTAAANKLDDYEEGDWTPTITFGGNSAGQSYAARRVGKYTRIGRLVTVTFFVQLTNKGTSTGAMSATGLPFAASSTDTPMFVGSVMFNGVSHASYISPLIDSGQSKIDFYETAENGARSEIGDTDVANNDEIAATVTYFV